MDLDFPSLWRRGLRGGWILWKDFPTLPLIPPFIRAGRRITLSGAAKRMPIYEYECVKNKHRFEVIQNFNDPPVTHCTVCGEPVEKLFTSAAIQFKGTGWYITDYARKGQSSSESSESKSSESKSSENKASTESSKTDKSSKTEKSSSDSGKSSTDSGKSSD